MARCLLQWFREKNKHLSTAYEYLVHQRKKKIHVLQFPQVQLLDEIIEIVQSLSQFPQRNSCSQLSS